MSHGADLVFPLIPSRRGHALDVAGSPSRRRGTGNEIASSRPYRRGDAIRLVDWAASARLSTARGSDEFIVRDHFADDAVRVVVVADRSPSMALFPEWLPWLHKPAAVHEALRMIIASGAAVNALIGSAAVGGSAARSTILPLRRGRAHWRAIEQHLSNWTAAGPPASLDLALGSLARTGRSVPAGTFVFVLSDFLPLPSRDVLTDALAAGWDVVPVVFQDPTWERSFPDVSGVTLPLADPDGGTLSLVRLSRGEAIARRELNESRAHDTDEALRELELDPVRITSSDPGAVHAAFLAWADGRLNRRGLR
jgi:uncharacterized protein (DUF58 family)